MAEVVFISDAHLGSGADSLQRERELCALLDRLFLNVEGGMRNEESGGAAANSTFNIQHSSLFLLGDIFDFWFTYRYLVPRGHVRLLGKLAELADAGVEIHFFAGNHDMWMFDYLEKEIGAIMHDEPTVFELNGKRLLVGHGDGLGHLDRGYDFLRFFFRSRFCQRLFKCLPSTFTFGLAHSWSDSNKVKHSRHDIQHYLGDDREGIVLYIKERLQHEHFDYCVFGHRHTPLVREINFEGGMRNEELSGAAANSSFNNQHSSLYVNSGDWLQNRSYAVLHTDGTMELHNPKSK